MFGLYFIKNYVDFKLYELFALSILDVKLIDIDFDIVHT